MSYRLLKKPYPLWRVEYVQVPRGEMKSDVYKVYVKIAENVDWYQLYTTSSSAYAEIALKRLQSIFDLYIIDCIVDEDNVPPMFELFDQVYKTKYMFPEQSCIVGEDIAGNQRYGEFNVDAVKYDYVADRVFFYTSGTALVKCNQLFIDGELICNSVQLKQLCDDIGQEFNQLDLYPEKIVKYIQEHYPQVKRYICDTYSSFFNE